MVEDALEHLSVREFYVPFPMLGVIFELPLVVDPIVAQLGKVLVVELLLERKRF